jgi:glutamate-5-semialdehyde dehydrogenase
MSATKTVASLADLARTAARTLTTASGAERKAALNAIAAEIEARSAEIVAANKIDIDRGIADGMHRQLQDRLLPSALKGLSMVRAKSQRLKIRLAMFCVSALCQMVFT